MAAAIAVAANFRAEVISRVDRPLRPFPLPMYQLLQEVVAAVDRTEQIFISFTQEKTAPHSGAVLLFRDSLSLISSARIYHTFVFEIPSGKNHPRISHDRAEIPRNIS